MEDRDVTLMLRFRDGDTSAFDSLVQRHKKGLVNYFYRFLGDRQWAEDAAQDVFCRLFRAAGRYEPRAKFTTYLYSIAFRHGANQLRWRRRRKGLLSLDRQAASREGEGAQLHQKVATANPGPRTRAERRELGDAIREAVLSLPVVLRSVFILCEEQGIKYEEAAVVLKVPVGTVKSRMYRAVRLLRKRLEGFKGEWYSCSAGE